MNIKTIVLATLILYITGASGILAIGFMFGDPGSGSDPAQSLLLLNSAAKEGIATKTNQKIDQVATKPSTAPTKTTAKKTTATTTPKKVAAPVVKTTPTPVPTPKPAMVCGSGGTCTPAQVASHNTQSNCWVRIGSKAYNVSSYVNSHPGGSNAFDGSTCGKDITAQMNGSAGSAQVGRHPHSANAYDTLNAYFVANIVG